MLLDTKASKLKVILNGCPTNKTKVSLDTVVTYTVVGIPLFLSSIDQFFEPALYYETSR